MLPRNPELQVPQEGAFLYNRNTHSYQLAPLFMQDAGSVTGNFKGFSALTLANYN